jgi:hypothetical protein
MCECELLGMSVTIENLVVCGSALDLIPLAPTFLMPPALYCLG